jgi:hypothetical protein
VGGNPIEERIEALLAAISSIKPTADACVVLMTGDVGFSGRREEYDRAFAFFTTLRERLVAIPTGQQVAIVSGHFLKKDSGYVVMFSRWWYEGSLD